MNTTWSFTDLTTTESSTDTYLGPTAAQSTNFPGTTNVFTSTVGTSTNDILFKENAAELSITGAVTPDLELNYSDDNALIGTFPLNFGYTNTDAVAGTYTAAISGDFSGNIIKTVDAYGTLNLNDVGAGAYSGSITRLKMEQIVTLSLPPYITNAGTATQTSYYYYDNSNGNLVFRSNTIHIVIPFASIDDTTTVNESLLTNLLHVNTNVVQEFSIVPNPVHSILNINLETPATIKAVVVYDLNGRRVLQSNHTSSIDVSALQTGMYIVQVETDTAIRTKKFIKN
ncbi:T9SS type A sorting domain-containing protein [Lacinutrix sp. C3R15]|uniref:T9SS type A sorting domain-containing protein n=1 Tax=Flavobacteriaceae TaxID=49546 RepID=UPI001C08C57A|nr:MULTISPECIES: T9SS type A sorting domain-containing protein [Flavobacteriaceae]MBU2940230.1 T9SS type A sorting domain-containing protein [Lacinutrix sp. C3R15]MDO6623548.1 T9SS type A sorting domain-containing protein [Oceanihabitans sp. 1_MG-2023]